MVKECLSLPVLWNLSRANQIGVLIWFFPLLSVTLFSITLWLLGKYLTLCLFLCQWKLYLFSHGSHLQNPRATVWLCQFHTHSTSVELFLFCLWFFSLICPGILSLLRLTISIILRLRPSPRELRPMIDTKLYYSNIDSSVLGNKFWDFGLNEGSLFWSSLAVLEIWGSHVF